VKGSDSRGLGFRDSKEAGIPYLGARGQHAPAAEHASRAAREKSQVHTRTSKSNEENAQACRCSMPVRAALHRKAAKP